MVGTAAGAAFSRSSGATRWRRLGAPSTSAVAMGEVAELACHPEQEQLWIVATSRGLWRSSDGGSNWESALRLDLEAGGTVAFSDVAWDPTHADVVYAAVGNFRSSREVGPGGDFAFEHAHVWRSEASGAAGSWEPLSGPLDLAGVHSLVPSPFDVGVLGSDTLYASSTLGVWIGRHDGAGVWSWHSASGQGSDSLPHGDTRELAFDAASARLYVALDSHWDRTQPTAFSIYDYDLGHGGGVWFSDDEGQNWFPTARADWAEGLFLEEGFHVAGFTFPKNVRRLAVDPTRGEVLLALTWGASWNEGVWRGHVDQNGIVWERMTETQGSFANVEPDGGGVLGAIDALWVDENSGDVIFSTGRGAWLCPGGDCRVGDLSAPDWIALHNGSNSNALDALSVHDADGFGGELGVRYLATLERGLLRSTDGVSWSPAQGPSPELEPDGPLPSRSLWLSPSGIAAFGLFESTEGEVELWSTTGLPHANSLWMRHDLGAPDSLRVHAVEFLSDDEVWAATEGGLFRGSRQGANWSFQRAQQGLEELEPRPTALACSPHHGGAALVALQGAGIYMRSAAATSWRLVKAPPQLASPKARVVRLVWSASDPDRVFALASLPLDGVPTTVVLSSANAGLHWQRVSDRFDGGDARRRSAVDLTLGLDSLGHERLWVALGMSELHGAEAAQVLVSDDGGANWSAIATDLAGAPATFLQAEDFPGGSVILGSSGGGARSLSGN